MTKQPSKSWAELLGHTRVLLESRLELEGKAPDLRRALERLNEAQTLIEIELRQPTQSAARRPARTGSRITEYKVEPFNGVDTLTEFRGHDSEPFRCPEPVFKAVAKFIAENSRPFDFIELFDTIRAELGSDLPDYRPRVCVRFLVAAGLLGHERRRFRGAKSGKAMLKACSDIWQLARSKPIYPPGG